MAKAKSTIKLSGNTTGTAQEDITLLSTGHLTATDSVSTATFTWAALNNGLGTYGSLVIAQDGTWTYSLNNSLAAVQALAAGQSVIDYVTVKVTDSLGTVVQQKLAITVKGTNDAPVITGGTATGTVQEDGTLAATGTITAKDVDSGAVLSWSLPTGGAGTYGSFTLNGSGTWSYALANGSAAVQALSAGEQVTDSVTVQVSDGLGGVATKLVSIAIAGANDGPSLTAAAGQDKGAVQEDGTLAATGTLTGSDPDAHDVLAWSVVGGGAGTYGSLAIDQAGHWTYQLANASAAVQGLASGQVATDSFTVQVSDGHGGLASKAVSVTVAGQDEPALAVADTAATTENGAVIIDVLANDVGPGLVVTGASLPAGQGSVSVSGNAVVFDPGTAFDHLAAGATAVVTAGYAIAGSVGTSSSTIAITVTGENDAPIVAAPLTLALSQGAAPATLSLLTGASDVDDGAVLSVANLFGLAPAMSVDAAGVLTVDAGDPAFQSLGEGESLAFVLSYAIVDQFGAAAAQSATVIITGVDDAPVANAGSIATDPTSVVVVDLIAAGLAWDPDTSDVLNLTGVAVSAGQGGTASIDALGQLVFDPGTDFAWMAPGDTTQVDVTYTVTDQAGLSATSLVTLTLTAPGGGGGGDPYLPATAFTAVDPATAASQDNAIVGAVLGNTPGIAYVDGSLQLTAGASSVGFYDGSLAGLGIGAGLLITSGTLPGASNTVGYFGVDNMMDGAPALDAIVNTVFSTVSYDATILSFDVNVTDAAVTGMKFNAVFGSDEFPEWVDAFVDIAAVTVNGVNYAYFNNDPMAPLSVIGSNLASNYFRDNTANLDTPSFGGVAQPGVPSTLPIEYDGISNVLTVMAPVHLGINHISIAIADTGDHVYDSGLFISNLVATDLPTSGVVLDVSGSGADDTLACSGASEIIDAQAGNDTVAAGAGDDVVKAGSGDDQVEGDAGNDYLDGGDGNDTAVYAGMVADYHIQKLANGHYQVEDLRSGAPDGTDELTGIETLSFLDGSYAVSTWDVAPPPPATGVTIIGTEEDDIVSAARTVAGQPGITDGGDLIDVGDGNDIVHGGAGADTVLGGLGHDELTGGGGNDLIDGGEGDDDMTGGSGADVFVFAAAADAPTDPTGKQIDRILDFSHADGDLIDLSAIGSFALVGGFTAGGMAELTSTKQDDGYLVLGDVDGDGVEDFAFFAVTATKLVASDFIM